MVLRGGSWMRRASLVVLLAGTCALGTRLAPAAAPAVPKLNPPPSALDKLIQKRVRYVFVIYQENRSFDHYFGTFPGANGIYSRGASSHGFRQYNPVSHRWTSAFRVATPDLGLLNNARSLVEAGINGGSMTGFVAAQAHWAQSLPASARSALGLHSLTEAASAGDEALAHVDCDTIPYLWMYASRFALFDAFFQGVRAPSAPSNVEIIAAQNGETEYRRYGAVGPPYTAKPLGSGGRGVPMFVDLDPAWGPYNAVAHSAYHQVDQTYANVLLNLEGTDAKHLTKYTQDIRNDIAFLASRGDRPVNWTWYQQGYANPADPERATLVTHHLAPHFFGYIANNPSMNTHVADITRFESNLQAGNLGSGGLFYLKGGYGSNQGLRPANAAPNTFLGDDDHPGESDLQVAEADVAQLVNAIARSRYWSQSAIVISWDDPGGYWDHVAPPKWLVCPDGHPCGNGQRVPLILISPFARQAVVHEFDDQSSVVKFAERMFSRAPLAWFPDEARYGTFGPRDASVRTSDLSGGFDPARLRGETTPISAQKAIIADELVRTIPSRSSCRSIGVRPVAPPPRVADAPPPGFNPRALVVPMRAPRQPTPSPQGT